MIEQDAYTTALSSFLKTIPDHLGAPRLLEITAIPLYLHLSADGNWKVTKGESSAPSLATKEAISIPLIFPLVPVILMAHVQTQLARLAASQQEHQRKRDVSFAAA